MSCQGHPRGQPAQRKAPGQGELCGHPRHPARIGNVRLCQGAFTGAVQDRIGRFQAADGGTIFLDEIGDLPLALQAKLLRVIEEKVFFRLGTSQTTKVDVRIISASNQGLERLVADKPFREDLYYRLNVFRIEIPASRTGRRTFPCWSATYSGVCARPKAYLRRRYQRTPCSALELRLPRQHPRVGKHPGACAHSLFGEHLATRAFPRLPAAAAAAVPHQAGEGGGFGFARNTRILAALRRHNGNRSLAARSLGMDRSTLWRKMRKHQLNDRSPIKSRSLCVATWPVFFTSWLDYK